MSSDKKLITIFGATGTQGGSVIESVLQNKQQPFALRAVTRNVNSEKAKALAARGVEIVKGDIFNKEDVVAAVAGAYGVFLNLNSEDPVFLKPGVPKENEVGSSIVDAAHAAGVQHLVLSALKSARAATQSRHVLWDFHAKFSIGEHAKSKGFPSLTLVGPAWYMENHLDESMAGIFGGFPLNADAEGFHTFTMPTWGGGMTQVPWVSITEDMGDMVHGVFLKPEEFNGEFVQAISDLVSIDEFVNSFERVTGKKSRWVPGKPEDIDDGGDDMMIAFKGVVHVIHESQAPWTYYGEHATLDKAQAAKAKAIAAAAKGQDPESNAAKLISLEAFWEKHFGA